MPVTVWNMETWQDITDQEEGPDPVGPAFNNRSGILWPSSPVPPEFRDFFRNEDDTAFSDLPSPSLARKPVVQ